MEGSYFSHASTASISSNGETSNSPKLLTGTDKVRITILGQIGGGKSSTANTILEEKIFLEITSPSPKMNESTCQTKLVNKTCWTIVDTPGFFNPEFTEEKLHNEMKESVVKCKPGPHVLLLIMRVGVYAGQNADSVAELKRFFGKDALKYTIICFTHGDELNDGQTIEDFVEKNAELKTLVDECGGRCHVIDNTYWNEHQDEYRNNRVQVQKLLNTVKQMQRENGGSYYTSEMLQVMLRRTGRVAWLREFAGNVIFYFYGHILHLFYWIRRFLNR